MCPFCMAGLTTWVLAGGVGSGVAVAAIGRQKRNQASTKPKKRRG